MTKKLPKQTAKLKKTELQKSNLEEYKTSLTQTLSLVKQQVENQVSYLEQGEELVLKEIAEYTDTTQEFMTSLIAQTYYMIGYIKELERQISLLYSETKPHKEELNKQEQ